MPIVGTCWQCGKTIEVELVGRGDECPYCAADMHVCRNCEFFDENYENDCREPSADRVVDNERANFCDWFRFAGGGSGGGAQEDPKAKLAALFGKKSD